MLRTNKSKHAIDVINKCDNEYTTTYFSSSFSRSSAYPVKLASLKAFNNVSQITGLSALPFNQWTKPLKQASDVLPDVSWRNPTIVASSTPNCVSRLLQVSPALLDIESRFFSFGLVFKIPD